MVSSLDTHISGILRPGAGLTRTGAARLLFAVAGISLLGERALFIDSIEGVQLEI